MEEANGKHRRNKGWDNLIPAKPGECRNPSGRPKGSVSLLTRIKKKLREKVKEGPHAGRRYADLAADAYVKACIQGEYKHLKELLDREEGSTSAPSVTVNVTQVSEDDLVRIATRDNAAAGGSRSLEAQTGAAEPTGVRECD